MSNICMPQSQSGDQQQAHHHDDEGSSHDNASASTRPALALGDAAKDDVIDLTNANHAASLHPLGADASADACPSGTASHKRGRADMMSVGAHHAPCRAPSSVRMPITEESAADRLKLKRAKCANGGSDVRVPPASPPLHGPRNFGAVYPPRERCDESGTSGNSDGALLATLRRHLHVLQRRVATTHVSALGRGNVRARRTNRSCTTNEIHDDGQDCFHDWCIPTRRVLGNGACSTPPAPPTLSPSVAASSMPLPAPAMAHAPLRPRGQHAARSARPTGGHGFLSGPCSSSAGAAHAYSVASTRVARVYVAGMGAAAPCAAHEHAHATGIGNCETQPTTCPRLGVARPSPGATATTTATPSAPAAAMAIATASPSYQHASANAKPEKQQQQQQQRSASHDQANTRRDHSQHVCAMTAHDRLRQTAAIRLRLAHQYLRARETHRALSAPADAPAPDVGGRTHPTVANASLPVSCHCAAREARRKRSVRRAKGRWFARDRARIERTIAIHALTPHDAATERFHARSALFWADVLQRFDAEFNTKGRWTPPRTLPVARDHLDLLVFAGAPE